MNNTTDTNQASEYKIEEELQAIFDGYNGFIDHEYQGTAYDRTDAINAIKAIIRTEKLKLLDEAIHQSTVNLKSAKAVAGWAELRKKQLEAEL